MDDCIFLSIPSPNLMEYDDVMNAQREVVYKRRYNALNGERLRVDLANMVYDTAEIITETNKEANDFKNFEFELIRYFSMSAPMDKSEFENKSIQEITKEVYKVAFEHYEAKMERNSPPQVLLTSPDQGMSP